MKGKNYSILSYLILIILKKSKNFYVKTYVFKTLSYLYILKP